MQIIERLLRVTGSVGDWTNELGKRADTPEVAVGVGAKLRFDLRSPTGDPDTHILLPLPESDVHSLTYYLAIDSDFLQETTPRLLVTEKIELTAANGHTYLDAILPNTAIPAMLAALEDNEFVELTGELGGYSGGADPTCADFVIQFPLRVRNRVYLGDSFGVPPEVESDSRYLTREQIEALLADLTTPEKGDRGEPGKTAYELAQEGGYRGSQEEWLASLKGEPGKSAYQIACDGGYEGSESAWLESLKGPAGLSAYQIALLQGFQGSESAWLESLRGEPGHDLHFDATGELSELDAYADSPKGFVFGAAVTDEATKTTKLYIYAKRSDEFNDWCNPTVLTFFEKDFQIEALPPVVMTSPGEGAEYFSFDASGYANATVAAVTIDTKEGELTLPYWSAVGVRKILRSGSQFHIYLGSQCPEFTTGKIYLTQLLGVAGASSGSGPGPGPSPSPGYEGKMFYGFLPLSVLGDVYKLSAITWEMVKSSSAHLTEADAGVLALASLGEVPAGSLVVVLIPEADALRAEKYNGVGGFVEFIEDNVEPDTGANGDVVTLNETKYKIYGEYVLAAAEIQIRVTAE